MAKEISNLITFNTYKFERGGLLVDMFNQFNARVGDQGTELAIQWETSKTGTKVALKERELHFFAAGSVGKYLEKLEDGTGFKMSADASTVSWEDKDGAGSLDDGITVAKLPKQFFPQKGIFFGYFGLKDRQGNIFTSVNVWFRVLGGVPTMGAAIPYFVTEFDEVLERCNGKIVDALAELREKYQAEVKKNEDMSAETRRLLNELASKVGEVIAQIESKNIVTQKAFNELNERLTAENQKTRDAIAVTLSKFKIKPIAMKNADAIKTAYPNGVDGLFLAADTGHLWIYLDGAWLDEGPFQSATLPQEVLDKLAPYQKGYMRRNLIDDPEFITKDEWTARGADITFAIDSSTYNGHGVLKVVSTTGKGGVYTTTKPVLAGQTISMSLISSFVSSDTNANASATITFLKDANASINDPNNAISSEGILSLNPDNNTAYQRFRKEHIIAPAGTKAMRMSIEFNGIGTLYLTEPLIVFGENVGPYELDEYQTQLEMMTSRKNLIVDPELNDESNFWTARNGLTIKRDKMKFNGHNVLHLSNHDVTVKQAFAVSGKMEVTPGQTLAFINEAYLTPTTTGSNASVQIAFYTKDEAGQDENFKLETKDINDFNSWQAFSFNNVTVPATAAYVRVKYVINGTGDLYIAVPMLVCNDHALLFDVDDLAKANPKSVIIDNPYYSTSRGYTWFHFDKITTDLYSDTQSLTWADYMNGTKGVKDDSYVENTWSPDGIGPAYSNHSKRLAYSIVTNRVTVTDKKSPYLINLLGYDDEQGYYGLLKDQYEALLDKQRQGTFKHLDGLTDDMIDKLDKKTDELYPLIADNDKFVFGLMADNHQTGLEVNNYRPNYTGMAYERVRQALDPDANFNLGDSVLSAGDNLVALRRAFEYTPAKDWVYCEGNHDRWVHDPILPPTQFYAAVNRVHRNDSRFHFGDGSNGAYYYVDYDSKKLRVIVLDDYDVGSAHDAEYNDKAGIRQAQFDWLANTALQVDDGWYVLVMVHQSPYPDMPENNRVANSNQLVQLFNAFETGVNTTITAKDAVFEDGTYDVNLTTNFKRPGKIIAVLSGHNHVDAAQVHNGVNYITTSCGYIDINLYHSKDGQPAKYGQRDQHTYSAISFDFGIINFKEQTLRLKRFGFGNDRTFKW